MPNRRLALAFTAAPLVAARPVLGVANAADLIVTNSRIHTGELSTDVLVTYHRGRTVLQKPVQ